MFYIPKLKISTGFSRDRRFHGRIQDRMDELGQKTGNKFCDRFLDKTGFQGKSMFCLKNLSKDLFPVFWPNSSNLS